MIEERIRELRRLIKENEDSRRDPQNLEPERVKERLRLQFECVDLKRELVRLAGVLRQLPSEARL